MVSSFDLGRIEDIGRWMNHFDGKLSLVSYVAENVEVHQAAAVLMVLWPKFAQIDGCYVWLRSNEEDKLEESVQTWMKKCDNDRSTVESVVNHLHLWDMFDSNGDDEIESALEWMASVLEKSWACSLKEQFPDVAFNVIHAKTEDDYGPTITVHAMR